MKLYDVTIPLREDTPTYESEPGLTLDYRRLMSDGADYNISSMTLGSHTGTHIDAPHHFIDGAPTVEQMPLGALVGPCVVINHEAESHVTAANLEAAVPNGTTRLLIKTRNGKLWDEGRFDAGFVAITEDAARWIVDRGIVLVGIDYMSIEPYDSTDYRVHTTLLARDVVIVEGVDLREVPEGEYNIACAPLRVVGAEGAPARVFLWID